MLALLDDPAKIKRLDSQNMLGSLRSIGKQVEQIAAAAAAFRVPNDFKKVRNVVFAGMGGSTLGAHFIKTLFADDLAVPLEIVNYYKLPAFAGAESLAVISSYSGTTEEALAALQDARRRKAKVLIITSGGELKEAAERLRIPALIFSTENNPCGSPRMGLGYTTLGPMLLLKRLGLVALPSGTVARLVAALARAEKRLGIGAKTSANPAKQFAQALLGRSVWYIGAEHLAGSAHIAANQMNENAKRFAGYFLIPELNHHLLEGLRFPAGNRGNLSFVLVESALYDTRIRKRFVVTKEILAKNKISFVSYVCEEKSRLEQAAETLVLSSYLSYYSALLAGIDPTAIPVVDYFKAALTRRGER